MPQLEGVFISNFMVGNFYSARKIFDVKKLNFAKLMEPIINSTVNNIKKDGAVNALSGSVERGDIKTVATHLNALKNIPSKRERYTFLLNYVSQSINLLEVVKAKSGMLSPEHLSIKKFLKIELRKLAEIYKK